MKYILLVSLLLLPFSAGVASADRGVACKAKEDAIRRQLEYARGHGNTHRVQGLERALANIRTWCSDDSLKARAELKVLEKEEDVAERERDLQEARAQGKPDKIAKRERKLEEARRELKEAEAARDALK